MLASNTEYEILTPNGFQSFDGINKLEKPKTIYLTFSDGSTLECSLDHRILTDSGFKKAEDLDTGELSGDFVYNQNGDLIRVNNSVVCLAQTDVYDPVNVSGGNRYISNNVVSHNCEFLGSAHTLIDGKVLRAMTYDEPQWSDSEGKFRVYEYPEEGKTYSITVDCSEGIGVDSSVINIFDVTEMPYKQVAVFSDNNISPQMLPEVIYKYAIMYNEAVVLIEIGGGTVGIGGEVANILYDELEYENLAMVTSSGRKGQVMNGGFGGKSAFGVKMTRAVKSLGCSTLKSLIEGNKLIVRDFNTFTELTTFVSRKGSFMAEEGKHDDLVMTLVSFAWLINQPYFKEMANLDTNIRKDMFEAKLKRMEEELTPVGFISTGHEDGYFVENGDVWKKV